MALRVASSSVSRVESTAVMESTIVGGAVSRRLRSSPVNVQHGVSGLAECGYSQGGVHSEGCIVMA
jgi:hypothetical protein